MKARQFRRESWKFPTFLEEYPVLVVDKKTAQYLLGHASFKMTMQLYTILDEGKAIGYIYSIVIK